MPNISNEVTIYEYDTGLKYFDATKIFDEIVGLVEKYKGTVEGWSKEQYKYLADKILNYIVFIGAVGLMIVALIPIMCTGFFNASVSFGGTSIIIIVGVVIETLKQIESQMLVRHYRGFISE